MQLNLVKKLITLRIIKHIDSLKTNNLKDFFKLKDLETLIKFIKIDKKNKSSKINLILLKKIGKTVINSNYKLNTVKKFLYDELK